MTDSARLIEERRDLARRVDGALEGFPEVTCTYVFGSVASGDVDAQSDVDLAVVCRPALLGVDARQRALEPIATDWLFDDQSHANPIWEVCDVNKSIDGVRVEIHYQTASAISEVLDQVVNEGAITTERIPFRPYTVAGLLRGAWMLRDEDGIFESWLRLTRVYPRMLKLNIIRHFAPILRESSTEFASQAQRRMGALGQLLFLFRAGDAMISILLALNEIYDPAARRQERSVLPRLTDVPTDLTARMLYIFEGPFDEVGSVVRSAKLDELTSEVLAMAQAELDGDA